MGQNLVNVVLRRTQTMYMRYETSFLPSNLNRTIKLKLSFSLSNLQQEAFSQNMVWTYLPTLNLGDDGLLTNFENNCLVCVILDLR